MKKKIVLGIVGVALLGGIFFGTYTLRSYQIDKESKNSDITESMLDEIDSNVIKKLTVSYDGKTYTSLDKMKDIEAGTVVDCDVVLESGKELKVQGYVTKGDENYATFDGNTVKITLEGKDSGKESEEK